MNSNFLRLSLIYAVFVALWAIPSHAFSQQKATVDLNKAYDPKEAIFEHIGDSHMWHVGLPFIKQIELPLPIILFTGKGLETFSSSRFISANNQEVPYQGKNYTYLLVKDKVKIADATGKVDVTKKVYDFSVTRNVASMWLGMILLLIIFGSVSVAYTKRKGRAPKGLQSFMEPVILFVRDDVAIPNIGVKYGRYMPLLLTIFFFILINNLLGLVPFFPGAYNLTGNISVTLTLSFIILIVINFSANKYYWKHIFTPDIPIWLYIIMVPVEIIGIFSKPIALMIRLFANITAGHIVVLSLISLIFILKNIWVSPASVAFVVFMDVLELLVAFLQAYIFTMLSALFIGMAIEEHHHQQEIV